MLFTGYDFSLIKGCYQYFVSNIKTGGNPGVKGRNCNSHRYPPLCTRYSLKQYVCQGGASKK